MEGIHLNLPAHMTTTMFVVILLVTVAAVPMAMRKVPRNSFYGFRTPKTMSSDGIWYDSNQKAGVNLIVAGGLSLLLYGVLRMASGIAMADMVGIPFTLAAFVGCLVVSFVQLRKM